MVVEQDSVKRFLNRLVFGAQRVCVGLEVEALVDLVEHEQVAAPRTRVNLVYKNLVSGDVLTRSTDLVDRLELLLLVDGLFAHPRQLGVGGVGLRGVRTAPALLDLLHDGHDEADRCVHDHARAHTVVVALADDFLLDAALALEQLLRVDGQDEVVVLRYDEEHGHSAAGHELDGGDLLRVEVGLGDDPVLDDVEEETEQEPRQEDEVVHQFLAEFLEVAERTVEDDACYVGVDLRVEQRGDCAHGAAPEEGAEHLLVLVELVDDDVDLLLLLEAE